MAKIHTTANSTIAAARVKAGLSQAGLAKLVGINQQQLNRLERGERKLKLDVLQDIARALKVDIKELLPVTESDQKPLVKNIKEKGDIIPTRQPADFGPETVPVLGSSTAGRDSVDINNGDEIGRVPMHPKQHGTRNSFALYVSGESMSPRYEMGDLVYVVSNRPPRSGDYVVVELQSGEAFIKRFDHCEKGEVVCSQLNPPQLWRRPLKSVKNIHIVVGTG